MLIEKNQMSFFPNWIFEWKRKMGSFRKPKRTRPDHFKNEKANRKIREGRKSVETDCCDMVHGKIDIIGILVSLKKNLICAVSHEAQHPAK